MLAKHADISTRDSAPPYLPPMRTAIFLPLLFILADGVACKEDEPTGGEFGEPCGYNPDPNKIKDCGEGLECYVGYCEEKCEADGDCQPVAGYQHTCDGGLCHIVCEESSMSCPQTLATSLECNMIWCTAIDGE